MAVFEAALGLKRPPILKCHTWVLKSVGTRGLRIISEEMRSISQKMRVGTPMAPIPHMLWREAASYRAMPAYSGQIDK